MSASASGSCELLPWDTEFFRCRIARICGDTLRPEQTASIDDWSRRNRIQCLYFLARADDPLTLQAAERCLFRLVDIRVTLEYRMARIRDVTHPEPPAGVDIRSFQPGDLPGLQAMARVVHQGTRFCSDSHFPRERVEDLYATWLTLETQGRASTVLIAVSEDDQPLGYISCHWDSDRRTGQIGLVGVGPVEQGKGIGRKLVLAALDWFETQGTREVTVVTQGSNLTAQRLYQQCGFLSRDMRLWYHKWYPPATEESR